MLVLETTIGTSAGGETRLPSLYTRPCGDGRQPKIFSLPRLLGVVADTETIQHLVDVKSATNSHTSMLPDPLRGASWGCYRHHQMI